METFESSPSGENTQPEMNASPSMETGDTSLPTDSSPTTRRTRKGEKYESLIEWFDRTVESELDKRRHGNLNVGDDVMDLETHPQTSKRRGSQKTPGQSQTLITDAGASHIDIEASLRGELDTELLDAVDKLAKAEAMITFEGAVRAAEEAAANAPPELAEDAAVAGAKGFQAEITGLIKEKCTAGFKPIEVVGYVGITRPKNPKKSQF